MDKEYYILREGDLFPESIKIYEFIGEDFLDELKRDGLLFESIEEARQVADILRVYIKLLRSKQCECIHIPFGGFAVDSHQDQPCASHQCQCNNSHSHKREHILRIVHDRDNEKTGDAFPKIEIAIHL